MWNTRANEAILQRAARALRFYADPISYIATQLREAIERLTKACSPHEMEEALGRNCVVAKPDLRAVLIELLGSEGEPVKMILHCPACGLQHIDAPSPEWDNPPHRSHLCQGCGHIWRPADVPTEGVASIKTRGKADSAPKVQPAVPQHYECAIRHIEEMGEVKS